jgi:hypothetical protein
MAFLFPSLPSTPSPVSVPVSVPIAQNPSSGAYQSASSGGAYGSNNIGAFAGAGSSTGDSSIVQYLVLGLGALAIFKFAKK